MGQIQASRAAVVALTGWLLAAALPAVAADNPAPATPMSASAMPANPPAAAPGTPPVMLFDVVTAKDVVEIGLTAQELRGEFSPLENLAKRLADNGHVLAWEYAVQHAADGTSKHAPVRRVAILRDQVLRIEPIDMTGLDVTPPNPPRMPAPSPAPAAPSPPR